MKLVGLRGPPTKRTLARFIIATQHNHKTCWLCCWLPDIETCVCLLGPPDWAQPEDGAVSNPRNDLFYIEDRTMDNAQNQYGYLMVTRKTSFFREVEHCVRETFGRWNIYVIIFLMSSLGNYYYLALRFNHLPLGDWRLIGPQGRSGHFEGERIIFVVLISNLDFVPLRHIARQWVYWIKQYSSN
jgi:hypothetical protein